jgi:hypothetical protein
VLVGFIGEAKCNEMHSMEKKNIFKKIVHNVLQQYTCVTHKKKVNE